MTPRIEKGKLIVISGPSGAGKSTVISRVMAGRDDICFSVSATTRAPRPGEMDGVQYFFIDRPKFEAMIEKGEFLEYTEYVGNCYGTPKAPVIANLEQGRSVMFDIEVEGAHNVKKNYPEAVTVFLAPPSFEELERRLRGRNQDSEEKILGRLQKARQEQKLAGDYDYIVINDDVDTAAEELKAIITAEKCRSAYRINYLDVEE